MSAGRLTELQQRVLRLLAPFDPPWTLTGGAALVGFLTAHRTTRDLDLFWQGLDTLDSLPARVVTALRREGLTVEDVQTSPAFHRLRVSDGSEVIVVDLVADPTDPVEPPAERSIGDFHIRVDTPHQILVNKLSALLGRSELRDLEDVQALLGAGGDLRRALGDASRIDGGFSPLTPAWILETFPLRILAQRLKRSPGEADALDRFRVEFIDAVTRSATPDGG